MNISIQDQRNIEKVVKQEKEKEKEREREKEDKGKFVGDV